MAGSNELQRGKAAEYLVLADLILQGHKAFLADMGSPYDIVLDTLKGLKRLQVKGTMGKININGSRDIYRFTMRRGAGNRRSFNSSDCDYYAFVALDIREIAYLHVKDVTSSVDATKIKECFEFKDKNYKYFVKDRKNGENIYETKRGRFLQDYSLFKL
jgi:hypothetical protein